LNYANGMMNMVLTDTVASVSFSTNVSIGNLPSIVGGSTAYVGFTAGDGGATSTQTITNFVFVSIPTATLTLDGTNALISWPAGIVGYNLQQNANLTTTNWVNVTSQNSLTNSLTVPATSSNLFYRLMVQ